MELLQERKLNLWEENAQAKAVSIEELESYLDFQYLPSLKFKTIPLQKQLLEEGLLKRRNNEVLPEHLENGIRYKKEIEESRIAPASVRWVDAEVGYGLFAEEDLDERAFIGEYVGVVRLNNNHLFKSNYLYSYPILDEIGRNFVIDAHKGCLTRFTNHSYEPNLRSPYAFVNGFYHMILLANRPIKKGEQLFFNYGKNYWAIRSKPKEL